MSGLLPFLAHPARSSGVSTLPGASAAASLLLLVCCAAAAAGGSATWRYVAAAAAFAPPCRFSDASRMLCPIADICGLLSSSAACWPPASFFCASAFACCLAALAAAAAGTLVDRKISSLLLANSFSSGCCLIERKGAGGDRCQLAHTNVKAENNARHLIRQLLRESTSPVLRRGGPHQDVERVRRRPRLHPRRPQGEVQKPVPRKHVPVLHHAAHLQLDDQRVAPQEHVHVHSEPRGALHRVEAEAHNPVPLSVAIDGNLNPFPVLSSGPGEAKQALSQRRVDETFEDGALRERGTRPQVRQRCETALASQRIFCSVSATLRASAAVGGPVRKWGSTAGKSSAESAHLTRHDELIDRAEAARVGMESV